MPWAYLGHEEDEDKSLATPIVHVFFLLVIVVGLYYDNKVSAEKANSKQQSAEAVLVMKNNECQNQSKLK